MMHALRDPYCSIHLSRYRFPTSDMDGSVHDSVKNRYQKQGDPGSC